MSEFDKDEWLIKLAIQVERLHEYAYDTSTGEEAAKVLREFGELWRKYEKSKGGHNA